MNRMLRAPSIASLFPVRAVAPEPGQKKRQAFGAWRFGLFRFRCVPVRADQLFPARGRKKP
jgi:hypothetical protein